ncbi:MAG: hypothetical protein HY293_06425 [Planctomycetes bacterium]|nr:hypothetical protein [Planctomycetota bacterium]
MKFSTSARSAAVGIAVTIVAVHVALKFSAETLQHGWLPTAVSIGLLFVSLLAFTLLHLVRHRYQERETLEIGRRGFMITQPDTLPFALAWRMIKTADLEQKECWQWRFSLKTGGEVRLMEDAFPREQWKKISAELQRKLKARKIPVRVTGAGQAPE